jgi:hypothetical protein
MCHGIPPWVTRIRGWQQKEGHRFAAKSLAEMHPSLSLLGYSFSRMVRSDHFWLGDNPVQKQNAPHSFESWDARLNSPPPKSAPKQPNRSFGGWEWLGWATFGNTGRVGRDARLSYRFLFPHKAAKQDIHSE